MSANKPKRSCSSLCPLPEIGVPCDVSNIKINSIIYKVMINRFHII